MAKINAVPTCGNHRTEIVCLVFDKAKNVVSIMVAMKNWPKEPLLSIKLSFS